MLPIFAGPPNNKVLLIESDEAVAARHKRSLEQFPGTTVEVVATLKEAVEKLGHGHGYQQIGIQGGIYTVSQGIEIIESGLNAQQGA